MQKYIASIIVGAIIGISITFMGFIDCLLSLEISIKNMMQGSPAFKYALGGMMGGISGLLFKNIKSKP